MHSAWRTRRALGLFVFPDFRDLTWGYLVRKVDHIRGKPPLPATDPIKNLRHASARWPNLVVQDRAPPTLGIAPRNRARYRPVQLEHRREKLSQVRNHPTDDPCTLTVREETPSDVASIFALNAAAFETDAEARLVDALRNANALTSSLVAQQSGHIVGHAAFSPVTITDGQRVTTAVGLGPMAVLPQRQRGGVGSALVHEGLRALATQDVSLCIVLGHPNYYPRFGFERACLHGIRWEHDVPDDVFFVKALRNGALDEVRGIVRYRPEFEQV